MKNGRGVPFKPELKYSKKSLKSSQKRSKNKSKPQSHTHTKAFSASVDPLSEHLSTKNVVSLARSSRSLKNSLKDVLKNRREKEIKKIKNQMAKLTMGMFNIHKTRLNLIEKHKKLLPLKKSAGVKVNPINIKWPTHINIGKQLQKKFEEMKNNEKSILKKQIEHKQLLQLLQR
tara:strand:- start:1040 stop:1561 length:522 start_codon:yes stop_codon:yes gene_type:complete